MNRKAYEVPMTEIIKFETEDIITASLNGDGYVGGVPGEE